LRISISFLVVCILLFTLVCSCYTEIEELETKTPTQYTLTVSVLEGGSVSPEASGTYDMGTTMTLSAIPDEGYRFVRWLGSDNDNGRCGRVVPPPTRGYCRAIVTLYSNRDIQAFFEKKLE